MPGERPAVPVPADQLSTVQRGAIATADARYAEYRRLRDIEIETKLAMTRERSAANVSRADTA